MPYVRNKVIFSQPLRRGCGKFRMLINAVKPSSPLQTQGLCGDERGGAGTELNYVRRINPADFPHDVIEETHIGFPASQVRQSIVGKFERIHQGALVAHTAAVQAREQPRPTNGTKGNAPGEAGNRRLDVAAEIGLRK